jgi:hypothetical protein
MKPVVNGLERIYGDRVTFVHINVRYPRGEEYARSQGWTFVKPYFVVLDGKGQVVEAKELPPGGAGADLVAMLSKVLPAKP